MPENYPDNKDIKIKWTKFNTLLVLVVTFSLILFLINQAHFKPLTLGQITNISGLYIDFWGVIIASLKTPYYGSFFDGGEIEKKRQKVDEKYFKYGMILVLLGLLLQALSTSNNFNPFF